MASEDFSVDVIHSIPQKYQVSEYAHTQELNLVLLQGSWKISQIYKRFEKLRSIYKQCNIGVTIESLREVQWKYPSKGLYYDLNNSFSNRYYDGTLQLLADLNIKQRPLVLFIDSFDEEINKLATSFPPSSIEKDSIALNTFWITDLVNEAKYLEAEPDDYSVFAHELGHILLNDSHEIGYESNLMHSKLTRLNGKLTPKQCETMRERISSREIQNIN
ncbi:MAG: hypothetical protein KC478_14950 [Bacteriovoracaceae bacterium]|nr:hypothetical protein [Bacteriovoracaceae bacterium]